MTLTLLTGGARSGKSRMAVSLARRAGAPVTFIATARSDVGMEERIARHRRERPEGWATIEETSDLSAALDRVSTGDTAIVDCVTVWVSNLMLEDHDDAAIEAAAERFAEGAATRTGETIVVTNEVGSGVHPPTELGLRFQDLLGQVNSIVAVRSATAYLCVAGRALPLPPADEVVPR